MKKGLYGLLLGILCIAVLAGCASAEKTESEAENSTSQKVELVVWGPKKIRS